MTGSRRCVIPGCQPAHSLQAKSRWVGQFHWQVSNCPFGIQHPSASECENSSFTVSLWGQTKQLTTVSCYYVFLSRFCMWYRQKPKTAPLFLVCLSSTSEVLFVQLMGGGQQWPYTYICALRNEFTPQAYCFHTYSSEEKKEKRWEEFVINSFSP